MIRNSKGYALIITCLLLPVVLLSIGLVSFGLLKTRHLQEMKSVCQVQYHSYFSEIKVEMDTIKLFGTTAVALYQAQMIMLPMIWMPPVLKAYRTLFNFRKKMERLQDNLIALFNNVNRLRSIQTFASIQRALYSENRKIKNTLTHQSLASYSTDPKLQIKKRLNITFPPYDPHPLIESRQKFTTFIKSSIQPKSWIQVMSTSRLSENFACSATLVSNASDDLTISYSL